MKEKCQKWTVFSGGSAENNPSNIANNHFNQVGFMTIITETDFDQKVFISSKSHFARV